jgi:excisionase family DNA binding protein
MLTISAGRRRLRWIRVESCHSRARKYSRSYLHWRGDEKVCRAITFDRNRAPRLLTIKEVADRLKVSVGCLRAWRIRGEGPPAVRVGSALRWDEREVDAWLNARRESGGLAS